MPYTLNYSGTLGFCPLKIKITQFPEGFCLKIILLVMEIGLSGVQFKE